MNDNPTAGQRGTILVVEDEALIRLDLCTCLSEAGYSCIEKSSAEAAQTAMSVRSGNIRLLLTDVRLNGPMNGLELAAWTRRQYPDVRVVITSGHTRAAELQPFAHAAFEKPFDVRHLIKTIELLL